MQNNEVVESTEQELIPISTPERRSISIPGAPEIKLQTLDLARHVAIAPDDRRYVVASFDEARLGHPFATVVYPQQNGYLTLVRLPVYTVISNTPDEALTNHVRLIQTIQRGDFKKFLASQR